MHPSHPPTSPRAQLSLLGDEAACEPRRASSRPPLDQPTPTLGPASAGAAERLRRLGEEAAACRACAWAGHATQTVFGRGPAEAQVVLVGEQPGDREDLAGAPFVGPAGQLLRAILAEVPLDVDACYLTNAVKHFKFTPTGKRRLHQRPGAKDIATCRPYLAAELEVLRPRLVVALGLVAAHGLMGKALRLGDVRGRRLSAPGCANTWVTSHPSAILRMPDPGAQARARALMVEELRSALGSLAAAPGSASVGTP